MSQVQSTIKIAAKTKKEGNCRTKKMKKTMDLDERCSLTIFGQRFTIIATEVRLLLPHAARLFLGVYLTSPLEFQGSSTSNLPIS